jgi:predicted dehydrogenase
MRIGIVGAGNIAVPYARTIVAAEGLELVAVADAIEGRAAELVAQFGGVAHPSLEALLADDNVDAVVNLTAAVAHAEVSAAALEAGKHVHSEKPLALNYLDAKALVDLAQRRGLGLSASPATLLGESQQTMWKLVRDGALGTVRVAYAEANWGKVESWHPSPATLYAVGAMGDVGVYPIAILTAMFGPARRVTAFSTTLVPDRIDKFGAPFTIERPDIEIAALELEGGVLVRVTASFYVGPGYQRGIELHGDSGILRLPTWGEFDSDILVSTTGAAEGYEPVEPVRPAYHGIDWSRALLDLAAAVEEGRPPRASGAHAAHVVEILDAIATSSRDGGPVEVRSSFPQPEPFAWAQ